MSIHLLAASRSTQAGKLQAEWTQHFSEEEGRGLRPCGPESPLLFACGAGLSNFGTAQSHTTASFVRCSDLSLSLTCVVVVQWSSTPRRFTLPKASHSRPSRVAFTQRQLLLTHHTAGVPPQLLSPLSPPIRGTYPKQRRAKQSIHRSPFPSFPHRANRWRRS